MYYYSPDVWIVNKLWVSWCGVSGYGMCCSPLQAHWVLLVFLGGCSVVYLYVHTGGGEFVLMSDL